MADRPFGFGLPDKPEDQGGQGSSGAGSGGSGGPKIYMTDIYGHAEFLVPTPSYASDPSWGPLLN